MSDETTRATQAPIEIERTYEATVEDLWDLWTTKEGLESWWGPQGFRVEVHALDLRVGGELFYDMIAVEPEMIAFMEEAGMGTSHATHGVFMEIEPLRRLKVRYTIDFLPGVEPYEHDMLVEFSPEGQRVRMSIAFEPHRDETLTQQATAGWESQLEKLPKALAARAARRA